MAFEFLANDQIGEVGCYYSGWAINPHDFGNGLVCDVCSHLDLILMHECDGSPLRSGVLAAIRVLWFLGDITSLNWIQ